jgi:DNA-binding MarR family transcriptional regulator
VTRPPALLAVLMALRVQGRAEVAAIAAATALDAAAVAQHLDAAVGRGDATLAEGVVPGAPMAYRLSPAGHAALAALLAVEPLDRGALASAYDDFLVADAEVKRAITRWQLLPAAERERALASLAPAAARAERTAASVASAVPRFAPYALRLATARRAIAAGDGRFVAGTAVESLHRVWFELHEDLLATLGRGRAT